MRSCERGGLQGQNGKTRKREIVKGIALRTGEEKALTIGYAGSGPGKEKALGRSLGDRQGRKGSLEPSEEEEEVMYKGGN